jgi:hypothetical protein
MKYTNRTQQYIRRVKLHKGMEKQTGTLIN